MNKKQTKAYGKQVTKDREELAEYEKLPNASSQGYMWCGEHGCRPGTCFPFHHPEAFEKGRKRK